MKPIKFKIDDIDPKEKFVNLFGNFSLLWGVRPPPYFGKMEGAAEQCSGGLRAALLLAHSDFQTLHNLHSAPKDGQK